MFFRNHNLRLMVYLYPYTFMKVGFVYQHAVYHIECQFLAGKRMLGSIFYLKIIIYHAILFFVCFVFFLQFYFESQWGTVNLVIHDWVSVMQCPSPISFQCSFSVILVPSLLHALPPACPYGRSFSISHSVSFSHFFYFSLLNTGLQYTTEGVPWISLYLSSVSSSWSEWFPIIIGIVIPSLP